MPKNPVVVEMCPMKSTAESIEIQLDRESINIEQWADVLHGKLTHHKEGLLQDRMIIPVSDEMQLWVGVYAQCVTAGTKMPAHIRICIEEPAEVLSEDEIIWVPVQELPLVHTIKFPVDFTFNKTPYRILF